MDDLCNASREQAKIRLEMKGTHKNTNEENSSVCNVSAVELET